VGLGLGSSRRKSNVVHPRNLTIIKWMAPESQTRRHADIKTTMNIYGDAATTADIRNAHEKFVRIVLAGFLDYWSRSHRYNF
jgi:hypothetical protein